MECLNELVSRVGHLWVGTCLFSTCCGSWRKIGRVVFPASRCRLQDAHVLALIAVPVLPHPLARSPPHKFAHASSLPTHLVTHSPPPSPSLPPSPLPFAHPRPPRHHTHAPVPLTLTYLPVNSCTCGRNLSSPSLRMKEKPITSTRRSSLNVKHCNIAHQATQSDLSH